jgi:AAA15 family ATPase/GTPase
MDNIKIKNLGPIAEADINFGDLTLFVGPQASGKSILLQLLKLVSDRKSIENTLTNYGFVWGDNEDDNLERFFGDGQTKVAVDGHKYEKKFLLPINTEMTTISERLFYIPAQRVVCLNYGWPRYFKDFEGSVPYVLRDFSELMRLYLEVEVSRRNTPVFPQKGQINQQLLDSFNDSIFHGSEIVIDNTTTKRLKLKLKDLSLPFMTWSAGQKEFMPLLLSFYWLCPSTINRRRTGVDYVVIEEPEMGLHPRAIKSVILQILDLIARGYKVIVSTHSPVLLEFAWAFNIFKESNADHKALEALFDIDKTLSGKTVFNGLLEHKSINTYYFDNVNDNVKVKDISTLDAGSEDIAISEWGGLSSFASRAGEIVSSIAARS